jgi:hypothetical protein
MDYIHSNGLQWNDDFPSDVATVFVSLVEAHKKLPDMISFLEKTQGIRTTFFQLNHPLKRKEFFEELSKHLSRKFPHFDKRFEEEQAEIKLKSEEQFDLLRLISTSVGGDYKDLAREYGRVKDAVEEVIQRKNYAKLKEIKKMLSALENKMKGQKKVVIRLEAPEKTRYEFVAVDAIDSFCRVRAIDESTVKACVPLNISERKIKEYLAEIIGETYIQGDWGGEKSDFFTTRLTMRNKRVPAAFLLKGAGTKGKLTIKKCGKQGNQIMRLLEEPAELFVVQHVDEIDSDVTNLLEKLISEKSRKGKKLYYTIMDGIDTTRVLLAYDKLSNRVNAGTSQL